MVLTCTNNLCFEQKCENSKKIQPKNVIFTDVKNRCMLLLAWACFSNAKMIKKLLGKGKNDWSVGIINSFKVCQPCQKSFHSVCEFSIQYCTNENCFYKGSLLCIYQDMLLNLLELVRWHHVSL